MRSARGGIILLSVWEGFQDWKRFSMPSQDNGNISSAPASEMLHSNSNPVMPSSVESSSATPSATPSDFPFVFLPLSPAFSQLIRNWRISCRLMTLPLNQYKLLFDQLTLALPFHPPLQIIAGTPLDWPAAIRVEAHLRRCYG